MRDIRQKIADTITDMVADFLYYRRKEDEELPVGAIEEAIAAGEISATEIVDSFAAELLKGIRGQ